jgi:nucleoside recognition membrane protein YjiH
MASPRQFGYRLLSAPFGWRRFFDRTTDTNRGTWQVPSLYKIGILSSFVTSSLRKIELEGVLLSKQLRRNGHEEVPRR